jgi:hypothetical protein
MMTNDIEDIVARCRWWGYSQRLRWYSENCSLSALPCFKRRVGLFVFLRLVLFIGLLFLALHCPAISGAIAAYFIVDALAVNTSYVFVTGSPINALRSVVFTMVTYFSLALAFGVGWVCLGQIKENYPCEGVMGLVVVAVYESVRILATVGPERAPTSLAGRVLLVGELLVGLYFVVIILALYASWVRVGRTS